MVRMPPLCRSRFAQLRSWSSRQYKHTGTATFNSVVVSLVRPEYEKPVGYWLLGTAGMVASVVCYGGYTRLTESGLSMTDWSFRGRPLPPTEDAWTTEFDKYKNTLEYQKVHYGLSLEEFKKIYFNEWAHRMLARATGLVFFLGAAYFTCKRAFLRPMFYRSAGFLALFASQGLVGWWMVRSGFEERSEQYAVPRVSPYRLAAHLSMAIFLYASLVWTGLRLVLPVSAVHKTLESCAAAYRARRVGMWLLPLAPLTFFSGVFVAGNDAGRAYNTWPKMIDAWIPAEVYQVPQNICHLFENTAVVQFNHRCLAYITVLANIGWYLYLRSFSLSRIPRVSALVMAQIAVLQAGLGISTLLHNVPISLGVLHQGLGLCLLTATLISAHTLKVPSALLRREKKAFFQLFINNPSRFRTPLGLKSVHSVSRTPPI